MSHEETSSVCPGPGCPPSHAAITSGVVALRCAAALLLTISLCACGDDSHGSSDVADGDTWQGFDDHTVAQLEDEAAYSALAAQGVGHEVVKFVITQFAGPTQSIRFLDGAFFVLHDEWYWYRLLNGHGVPGSATAPVAGMQFESIEAITRWARDTSELPLDLRFVSDGRLYSPEFYNLALSTPRGLGIGTVIAVAERLEAPVRDEVWAFELEYVDAVEHGELVTFFEALEESLPASVRGRLMWLVRSPAQETLARKMERELLAYHDRVLRYSELAVPGEVEVYSEGITAGRLRAFRADEQVGTTSPADLLLFEMVPDWLPAGAGLITAVPQTPLAHINVLARNRGIPNAYRGGLFDDPAIDQLARVSAPAIVRAVAPDQLDLIAMAEADYVTWLNLQHKNPIAVPPVDVAALPYTYDLAALDVHDVEALCPAIGGKAAGFLGLMAVPGLELPPDLLVVTVKAYAEHIAQNRTYVDAVLGESSFQTSVRTRFLLLEGVDAYDQRYVSGDDQTFRAGYIASHPSSTPIGAVLRAGGLKAFLCAQPLPAATRTAIVDAVRTHFGAYAATQGLRFRSSSSVEDIEGFNGAGLYTSNTGYLDPTAAPLDEQHKSVEWALAKTWASYWGFEAYEERRMEGVDHLSGNMAVLVHARFDDPKEVNNGVFTFTVMPTGHAERFRLELNAQVGAESVTNPTPGLGALPEVTRVRELRDGVPGIERLGASTLVAPGEVVLDDAQVLQIFGHARDVTQAWLARDNAALVAEQASSTLTLDFEFRTVARGWPAQADGSMLPARTVVKQARPLEPSLRHVPESLQGLPFPRDVLRRAQHADRIVCDADTFSLTTAEVFTDRLMFPDMGFADAPHNGFISLELTSDLAALGLNTGYRVVASHLRYQASHPVSAPGAWALELIFEPDAATEFGLSSVSLGADGSYTLEHAGATVSGTYSCALTTLLTTPVDFLHALLARDAP